MIKRLRGMDRRLFTILMIVFVQILGASLILPILPLYAQRRFAMSAETIALLVSSFFAAQFIAGPYIGRLSDRYGRLPVLIWSQVGTAVSFVMLAFAPNVELLFAARILDGITGGNIIVAQAYVTDITPRHKRTAALGYIFAAFGLGFVFGPALGGVLSALFTPQLPFLVAAVAATATIFLTWYTLTETVTPEWRAAQDPNERTTLSPLEVLRNYPLMLILVIAFVGQASLGLLQATFALYGEAVLFTDYSDKMTDLGIGLMLTAVGITQLIVQTVLLQRLLDRFGDINLIAIGNVLRSVGMFAFALITTPWLGPLAIIFFAMGSGISMPPLQSLSTNTVTDRVRGGVLGWYQSALNLSIILSTAVGGILFAINPVVVYLNITDK
jgi:MFS transporter, DHA1 family, tetracycline resistance protein